MKSHHQIQPVAMGSLRPRERVRAYLSAEFERPDLQAGSRLPTMRQLASQLSVSVPTVQSVFRELARAGRIRTQLGNGSFLVAAPRHSPPATFRIALNIPMLHSSPIADWGTRILQEILQAAACHPQPVMIMPLRQAGLTLQEMAHELIEERSSVDALILFPRPERHAEEIRNAYEKAGKPVVAINPPSLNTTTNFVSTDFYGAARRLGQVWKNTGRRRVVFISEPFTSSASAQLECQGLMAGLEAYGAGDITFQILPARSILEEEGQRVMAEFLDQEASPPDAVFCFGDGLALGALQALQEGRLDVPKQVSVVGATGVDLSGTSCPHLTRLAQPFRELSEAAVAMVCERIEQKGVALPGRILATPFIGGATTREEENNALEILESELNNNQKGAKT